MSVGISQNRNNATSSFGNYGENQNRGADNVAQKPVSYCVTQNKNESRQSSGPKPVSYGTASSKDEDITFLSQTKPLQELSNVGGPRKMVEKNKKVTNYVKSLKSETI